MGGRRIKTTVIYALLAPGNAVYVGQTTDLINRRSRYKTLTCKNQTNVYASLLLHGYDKHEFKILKRFDSATNREELDYWETFYFSIYEAKGYKMLNLKSPGWNGRPNAEALKRLSDAHLGQIAWNKGLKGAQVAWNKGLKKEDYAKK